MIGKITTGSNFNGLFDYLLNPKKQPQIIDGDCVLLTLDSFRLAKSFNFMASFNRRALKPVKHISISFAPADGIIEEQLASAIARDVVEQLGYNNNQWIAIAHGRNDPQHDWEHHHDHLHIVINMIDVNGKRVRDSFDKTRLEQILRGLETEHNLTPVQSSRDVIKARVGKLPATGQIKRIKRELSELIAHKRTEVPEMPKMLQLQGAINAASKDRPTMTVFISRLQHLGIDVQPLITDKGRNRISYRLGDFKVAGCRLYNGSFPKLIKHRGINFDDLRDRDAIEKAQLGKTVKIDSNLLIGWDKVNLSTLLPPQLRISTDIERRTGLLKSENELCPQPIKKQEKDSFLERHYLAQRLFDEYKIPNDLTNQLIDNNLLSVNSTHEIVWQELSLPSSLSNGNLKLFWFQGNSTSNNEVIRIVITSNPPDAVAAYLSDLALSIIDNENYKNSHYLSVNNSENISQVCLDNLEEIVLAEGNIELREQLDDSNQKRLEIYNISSWQQYWLELSQMNLQDRQQFNKNIKTKTNLSKNLLNSYQDGMTNYCSDFEQ
jgi:hypothetical protein